MATFELPDQKFCEQELSELKEDIPIIEEEKVTAFETGLLLAQNHTKTTPFWEQIDWTTIYAPEEVRIPIPAYFLRGGKANDLFQHFEEEKEEARKQKDKGKGAL